MTNYTDSPGDRERVRIRIQEHIYSFQDRVGEAEWHMKDLLDYVLERSPHTSPASPQRILQLLRRQGKIDYTVLSRGQSLYRFPPRSTTDAT